MAKSTQDFFYHLTKLEKEILLSPNYKKETKDSLEKIIQYVVSCPFHTTTMCSFICANFRLPRKELYHRYKSIYNEDRQRTFMNYISICNTEFNSIFYSVGDFDTIYLTEDTEGIRFYNYLLLALNDPDALSVARKFDFSAFDFIKTLPKTQKSYTLGECEKEIAFLSKYYVPNVTSQLDGLNKEKLSFVLDLLSEKLIGYKKVKDTDNYDNYKTINPMKIQLLKRMGLVQPIVLEKNTTDIFDKGTIEAVAEKLEQTEINTPNDTTQTSSSPTILDVGKVSEYFKDNYSVNQIVQRRLDKENSEADLVEYTSEMLKENEQLKAAVNSLATAFVYMNLDYFAYFLDILPKGVISFALENYKRKEPPKAQNTNITEDTQETLKSETPTSTDNNTENGFDGFAD